MIFVTVGTHTQPFNGLLQKIDEPVEKGIIKEKVITQIGYALISQRTMSILHLLLKEKI
jgi:UDP-N-acetylglucosamine transferase subunit ALG13